MGNLKLDRAAYLTFLFFFDIFRISPDTQLCAAAINLLVSPNILLSKTRTHPSQRITYNHIQFQHGRRRIMRKSPLPSTAFLFHEFLFNHSLDNARN